MIYFMTDDYIQFARTLALEAGDIMKQYFSIGLQHTLKNDHSPVTIADQSINQMVIDRVKARFPGHGVLGEEDSFATKADNLWVVDPIDGTMPFLRGVPTNVFSLAFVQKGKPIAGVIYDPYMDRLFYASAGRGAYMNGKKLAAGTKKTLDHGYMVVEANAMLKDLNYRKKLESANVMIFSYGSLVYGFCLLAAGQLDGVVFPLGNPWDVAAGKILIEEAGGVTSDMYGKQQPYNKTTKGFIASATPEFHNSLTEVFAGSLK